MKEYRIIIPKVNVSTGFVVTSRVIAVIVNQDMSCEGRLATATPGGAY
jgi:hypothetical protein